MRLPAGVLLILALAAFSTDARIRAVHHPESFPAPRSVLWIAAHPDDEAVVAPLLFKWCVEEGARCRLLVLTRGEAGPCLLPQGCLPDVASVRSAEAGAASELFHAESVLLRYADGGGVLPPQWQAPDVQARIAKEIASFDPDLILTFDPRHGSTCHPDHREVGRLVLAATEDAGSRAAVYLLETFVEIGSSVQFLNASSTALRFDAEQKLSSGVAAWTAVTWDMRRHPSQFSADLVAIVENVPPAQRSVFIAPASLAMQEPARQCP